MTSDRLARLARAMRDHGLQAIALNPGPSLFFFTGLSFHLMERPVVGLFTPELPPHLVLPELEAAKAEALDPRPVLFTYGEDEGSRAQAFAAAAASLGLGGRRVGVEALRLRVLELRLLEAAAPGAAFAAAEPALAPLRAVKDADEVDAMRRAVAAAETALEATLPRIRAGMTERELASELTLQLLRAGSDTELPFPPIVASGPQSALPHAIPGDRRLQPGDMLIVDWGAAVGGYISDLTRTFAVARVDGELSRIHAVVAEANAAGRDAARPGAACADVDRAARAVIEAAGYGGQFIHRTGHGIGLEAHEPPYISADNQDRLAPGMTFTVEPGIYLPGRGGARVEDNLLITPAGAETLTSLPRELRVVG